MPSPNLTDEVSEVSRLYRLWRDSERTLKNHREKVESAAREADYLRSSVEELEKLSPQDGEEEELADRLAEDDEGRANRLAISPRRPNS